MKIKMLPLAAGSLLALLLPLQNAHAFVLEDLLSYFPGYTQTHTSSPGGYAQPQYNVAYQYNALPAPEVRTAAAPRPAAPQPSYQQYVPQAPRNVQPRQLSQAAPKKKSVTAARPGNTARTLRAQPAGQQPQRPVARAYPPSYPDQSRPAVQQAYNYPQAGGYTNPQPRYTAAPNYYGGYYNYWNSLGQACPPGRA